VRADRRLTGLGCRACESADSKRQTKSAPDRLQDRGQNGL
jgi:hypothetical protein